MTTDPQTAADAADETRRFLTAWINTGQPNTIAVAGGHMLTVPQLGALLADRARLAAELEQAAELLDRLAAPYPCDADTWGDCPPHGFFGVTAGELCPHGLGRRFVEAWRTVQGEAAKKGPQSHAEDPAPSPRPTPGG